MTLFSTLKAQAPDPLLSLIGLYRADERAHKLDLGVGIYRDETGATPVMKAMKKAEQKLVDEQSSKSYLGPEGDVGFVRLAAELAMGDQAESLVGVQTPGGTGALRLAFALIHMAKPDATVWLGTPSWPVHANILDSAGLKTRTYRHYDPATGLVDFEALTSAFNEAAEGDVVLLHGCCHNPSGANLSADQWAEVIQLITTRGLFPVIDLAYQGLGDSLVEDAAGARQLVAAVPEALIAYSCDKNFGLYRDRVGALFAKSAMADVVEGNLHGLARVFWSMPPDHGAAATRLILEDDALKAEWSAELDEMRARLNGVRMALAEAHPALKPLAHQRGMFSILPLNPEQVGLMRRDHAIYMAGSGRINLAGLTLKTVPQFVQAFATVLDA